jgi:nucleotide-binding universal stress UspA family protein
MTYLVGYTADRGGQEALALSRMLAHPGDVTLTVCIVVPETWDYPSPARVDAEYAAFLRQYAKRTLAKARATLGDSVKAEYVSKSAPSATSGLVAAAREAGASLIVLGSAREGPKGRFTVGSVTTGILQVAPVPVALAPRGYRPAAEARLHRVTCAYRGSPSPNASLDAALSLCRRHGVPLRLTTLAVRDRQMYPSGVGYDAENVVINQWRQQAAEAQQKLLADLPKDIVAQATVGDGPNWKAALDSIPWEDGEVLVVGSSRLGPMAKVFLGANGVKIIRSAPVPVIVVPRGAATTLGEPASSAA